MKNLAVINLVGLSPLAYKEFLDGSSAFQMVQKWAAGIPLAGGVVLITDDEQSLPGSLPVLDSSSDDRVKPQFAPTRVIRVPNRDESAFMKALDRASRLHTDEGTGPECLFLAWGDCPLIDSKLTVRLWELHYRYNAQYTFADGYPEGLAPQLIAAGLPRELHPLVARRASGLLRDSFFEILREDINAFDVETHLSPRDLRMHRVALNCATRRNRNITRTLFNAGGVDARTMCDVIPERLDLLRDLPIYFPVQISNHCPQACSYCPFPQQYGDPRLGNNHMDCNLFRQLCEKIVRFAGDAVIGVSLWGEPASHPRAGDIIEAALTAAEPDSPDSIRVLVETAGIGWKEGIPESLLDKGRSGQLMWIVSLDSAEPEMYRKLRGEGLEEAEAFARRLIALYKGNCWVQAVRMNENEEHLQGFRDKWVAEGAGVIIQKYNSYASILPERQPSDLSPIIRHPCWHLKRDMPILIDGSVPICREDLSRRELLGNAFTDKLEDIWEAGNPLHLDHVQGKFNGPCAKCDEYYTFNF